MTWGLKELGPLLVMLFSVGLIGTLKPGVDGLPVSAGSSVASPLQPTTTAATIAATPTEAAN